LDDLDPLTHQVQVQVQACSTPVCDNFCKSFLAYSQQSQIAFLPYFDTWCGISANLECKSEMCCTRLAGNTGCKNDAKSPSAHHSTTLSGYIFASEACIDNRKNTLKSNISSTCPHSMVNVGPLMAEIGSEVWASQLFLTRFASWLRYCSDVTQPNFARCLVVSWESWAGTSYIHFRQLLPLREFFQVQNSLCVQILCSSILTALQHGTPAAGVSQNLRRATRNGITELSQTAPPIFGWAAITLGIGPHSSLCLYSYGTELLPPAALFETLCCDCIVRILIFRAGYMIPHLFFGGVNFDIVTSNLTWPYISKMDHHDTRDSYTKCHAIILHKVRIIPRLHDTTGCQTGLYNRFDNSLYRVNGALELCLTSRPQSAAETGRTRINR